MATRSRIGVRYKNGTVKAVYCHWDGYPDEVGSKLLEFYNSVQKVESLMEKFKDLVEYPTAISKLQQILKENPKKHFVSIAVSPSEVSYQIFNREDAIKHLIKHFGV